MKKLIVPILAIKMSLFACTDYWNPNTAKYVFLDKKDSTFLNYSENLNDVYNLVINQYLEKNKKENLTEWKKALDNKYSEEELEKFIYEKENLTSLKDKEALEYIKFAQAQESCVTFSYLEEKPKNCKTYTPQALEKLEKTKNEFLKQRYFYLALRLAHYNKENPLQIYEKYSSLLDSSNSIVKDWVQALYAGALVKNGNKEQGVYEFSKLFDEAINSHLALYNFFHIRSQESFDKVLNLASTKDEKTKIYTLRALDSGSNIIEEIENIQKIDKNSKWIDFLLYKELMKSQTFFNDSECSVDNKNLETKKIPYEKYIKFLENLKKDDKYLSNLSLVYFNIYTNKLTKAKDILETLKKQYPNSNELEKVSYLIYLKSLTKIDLALENEIFSKMQKFFNKDGEDSIFEFTLSVLSKLYKKQNQDFDAFLMKSSIYINPEELDKENSKKFNDFLKEKPKSKFKEYLQKRFKETLKNDNSL